MVPQPQGVEKYYRSDAAIDQHSRCRQDNLGLERKIQVKDWSKRDNLSLVAICVVDACLLYKRGRGEMERMAQSRFNEELAEQLIENNYGQGVEARNLSSSSSSEDNAQTSTSGRNEHLTPTKKGRRILGRFANSVAQGWCAGCRDYQSRFVCSGCHMDNETEIFYCHSHTKRMCYCEYLVEKHFDG